MKNINKGHLAKAQSTQKLKAINNLSYKVIGAAIEVHRILGPGLLESVYHNALCFELEHVLKMNIKKEHPIQVKYKQESLDQGFRIDILVESQIVLELKSVEEIKRVHKKQLLTYLRLSSKNLGLLINFNEEVLTEGITRIVNNL